VTHLWLAPHTMRVGVGRALIEAALAHAAARTAPPLEVEADPHAAPFYERLGFARVGTVPAPMPGDARRVLVALRFAR
jgi:GNAT superfamily N-acetyltransferase